MNAPNPATPIAPPPVAPPRARVTADLAQRLKALDISEGRWAVALSGGPDSLALAALLAELAPVTALIVDHGLRPESALEAAHVKAQAEKLGLTAHVLRWEGEKPATRIMERARTARYALLLQACHRHGCSHLFLGHQADDQAETIAMRQAHGSGWRGLAGMPDVAVRQGIVLVRPLLPFPKADLIETCRVRGLIPVDDPSNRNPRYERVRVRLAQPDVIVAPALRQRRQQELQQLASLCTLHEGWAELDPAQGQEPELLRLLINLIGQQDYAPDEAALRRFTPGRTLGGCRLQVWRGRLVLAREPAAVQPVRLAAGVHQLYWDRQWQLSFQLAEAATLAPLGALAWRGQGADLAAFPGIVRASLPVLQRQGQLVAWPARQYLPYFNPFRQVYV